MSLVSLAEGQSRAGASVTQDMIDETEEALKALIGPLTGSRTETFYLSERRNWWRIVDGLYLSRRTNLVTLTSDGSSLDTDDYRLLNAYVVERPSGSTWGSTMVATYEPNDEETVRSVIFDWLQYRQTPAGLQSIRIGAYSETFFPAGTGGKTSTDPVVEGFVRRVLPAAGLGLTSPFRYCADRRDRTLITGGDGS